MAALASRKISLLCESWQQKLNIATQRNGVIKLHPSKADIKFVVLYGKFTA